MRRSALVLVLALAGAALPRAGAGAAPGAASDWRDLPANPGDWVWADGLGQSVARYVAPGEARPLLTLTCQRTAGSVQIALPLVGGASPRGAQRATVTTSSVTRTLDGVFSGGREGLFTASLSARDPLLDAMAFSRGRFMVEAAGGTRLLLPAWPEVARVIEDCRRK